MGNKQSNKQKKEEKKHTFKMIPDQYETLEEVQNALRLAGLECSELLVFVDYTKSNTWQGKKSFGGKSLHDLSGGTNPYLHCIDVIGRTLSAFDDDQMIPCHGFGDQTTKSKRVFPFIQGGGPCDGLEDIHRLYQEITPNLQLSGPTSFAPCIRKAIEIVQDTKSYHIALILTDGNISEECRQKTAQAIIDATNYPLSIVVIGLGDGPFDLMEEFDDELPERKFDNFQFVNYEQLRKLGHKNFDAEFSLMALMEIPEQYKCIRKLGLLVDMQ